MAGGVRRGIAFNRAHLTGAITKGGSGSNVRVPSLFSPSTDEWSNVRQLVLRLSYKHLGPLVVRRETEQIL
jgi:hypothetical protein